MVLDSESLYNIVGGAATNKIGIGLIITTIGTIIIGIIDGFLRPLKCN